MHTYTDGDSLPPHERKPHVPPRHRLRVNHAFYTRTTTTTANGLITAAHMLANQLDQHGQLYDANGSDSDNEYNAVALNPQPVYHHPAPDSQYRKHTQQQQLSGQQYAHEPATSFSINGHVAGISHPTHAQHVSKRVCTRIRK
jgi:hypothetical protein